MYKMSHYCNVQEVDSAGHGNSGSVLSHHVEMCGAVIWMVVERRTVVRNIVGGRVVDSPSYHLGVFRACQVSHQLQPVKLLTIITDRPLQEP